MCPLTPLCPPQVWLRFPREGSEVTPPHPSNDFKWKDYCPTAFKCVRPRLLVGGAWGGMGRGAPTPLGLPRLLCVLCC